MTLTVRELIDILKDIPDTYEFKAIAQDKFINLNAVVVNHQKRHIFVNGYFPKSSEE